VQTDASKNKENILDLANDYNLTGFCMAGKPGIVCLEGILEVCEEVWSIIKQWNWKKISVKYQENADREDLESFKKFDKFEEIGFVKVDSRDNRIDTREFFRYLQDKNCQHVYNELFGIDKS